MNFEKTFTDLYGLCFTLRHYIRRCKNGWLQLTNAFDFNIKYIFFGYFDPVSMLDLFLIININIFWGDLTNVSDKTKTLQHFTHDVSFYNNSASTWTLATPRTTWESRIHWLTWWCLSFLAWGGRSDFIRVACVKEWVSQYAAVGHREFRVFPEIQKLASSTLGNRRSLAYYVHARISAYQQSVRYWIKIVPACRILHCENQIKSL